jgi:hypothetical protein
MGKGAGAGEGFCGTTASHRQFGNPAVHPEDKVQRVGAKAPKRETWTTSGNPGGVETAQVETGFDGIEGEHGRNLQRIERAAAVPRVLEASVTVLKEIFDMTLLADD